MVKNNWSKIFGQKYLVKNIWLNALIGSKWLNALIGCGLKVILESWLKVILNLGDSTSPIPWCEKQLSKTAQCVFRGFFGTLKKFKNAPNQGRVDCFLWFWDKFEQPYRWAGAPPRPLSLAVPLRGTTTNEQVEILMPQNVPNMSQNVPKCWKIVLIMCFLQLPYAK